MTARSRSFVEWDLFLDYFSERYYLVISVAEEVGFEPTAPFKGTPIFEIGAF